MPNEPLIASAGGKEVAYMAGYRPAMSVITKAMPTVSTATTIFLLNAKSQEMKCAHSDERNNSTTTTANTNAIATSTADSAKKRPTNAARELPRILRVFTLRIRIGTCAKKKFT